MTQGLGVDSDLRRIRLRKAELCRHHAVGGVSILLCGQFRAAARRLLIVLHTMLQTGRQPKDCGVLAVRVERDPSSGSCSAELTAVHCSASMGFAYCTGGGSASVSDGGGAALAPPDTVTETKHSAAAGPGNDKGAARQQSSVSAGGQGPCRHVHSDFLRQTVHDPEHPSVCRFTKHFALPCI